MSSTRGAKIFVGHLHSRTSERELYDIFERYGRIHRIDLKHCYAFIDYNNRRDAEDAVHAMNGREIDGERIVVEWTRGNTRGRGRGYRPERSDYRVRIENLPEHAHWQDLKDYFRRAGDVIYGDINGTIGVIEFRYPEDVPRAIKEFDRTRWNGSTIYVSEDPTRKHGRKRSRSRSDSRSRSRTRSRSRSRSYRRSPPRRRHTKSRSKSRDRGSPSASPKRKSPSPSKSPSRSKSKKRDTSKSVSPSPNKRRSKSPSVSPKRVRSESKDRRSPSKSRSRSPDNVNPRHSLSRSRSVSASRSPAKSQNGEEK